MLDVKFETAGGFQERAIATKHVLLNETQTHVPGI